MCIASISCCSIEKSTEVEVIPFSRIVKLKFT